MVNTLLSEIRTDASGTNTAAAQDTLLNSSFQRIVPGWHPNCCHIRAVVSLKSEKLPSLCITTSAQAIFAAIGI